jgi:hypothetical protein
MISAALLSENPGVSNCALADLARFPAAEIQGLMKPGVILDGEEGRQQQ